MKTYLLYHQASHSVKVKISFCFDSHHGDRGALSCWMDIARAVYAAVQGRTLLVLTPRRAIETALKRLEEST